MDFCRALRVTCFMLLLIGTGPWSTTVANASALHLRAVITARYEPDLGVVKGPTGPNLSFELGGNHPHQQFDVTIEELLSNGRRPATLAVAKPLQARHVLRAGQNILIKLDRNTAEKILLFTLTTP